MDSKSNFFMKSKSRGRMRSIIELTNEKVKEMIKPLVHMLILLLAITSCKDHNEIKFGENEGYNMLLIGNSFFKPYAQKLDILTTYNGIQDHNQTLITRG